MFGYVKTDIPNMYVKDTVLYRSMYCGLCKSIGRTCGTKARFCLNYDLTFLSVFCHNLLGIDVKIEKKHCAAHPITKRPIAKCDELSDKIACLNVILAYYKIKDDIIDNGKGKLKKSFFNKGYQKASKKYPEFIQAVEKGYNKLRELEKEELDSIDIVSDPFGIMMQEVIKLILEKDYSEEVSALSYSLGKWIYLIDAVDDFDKDLKKKNFNVLVNSYKDIKTKKELLEKKKGDLELIFGTVLTEITENAKRLKYKFNHDLTDNILFKGLKAQTNKVLENETCKNCTKF